MLCVYVGLKISCMLCFFFFQAEDGIRDYKVTGVQTCALPISLAALVAQMRNPEERRGDLRAQLAAHHLAERRMSELCERRGRDRVVAGMNELLVYSERRMRSGIAALPDGHYEATDVLEAL